MTATRTLFDRPVHGLERVWLAADRMAGEAGDPPFLNQQVVEDDGGAAMPSERLAAALARAGTVWPGLAARLYGCGRWSRWRTGAEACPPVVRTVDGTAWDGQGPAGAPWLLDRLDPMRGPLAELIHAPRCADGVARMVVRTHHAVVDGRAAGAFTDDLFRVLRGEEPLGAEPGPVDLSLAGEPSSSVAVDATPVLTPVRGVAPTWRRVTLLGPARDLLPRVLRALADASEEGRERACWRFSVPADLRVTHVPRSVTPDSGDGGGLAAPLRNASPRGATLSNGSPSACANLTGLLRVELGDNDTYAILRSRIEAARGHAGVPLHAAHALRDVPLSVLAWFGRRGADALFTHHRSEASATVSNLGRADLAALSCPGWTSTRTWWIPPGSRGNACFVSLSGGPGGLELVASAPVSADALARYLSRVGAALEGVPVSSPELA